jgi:alkylation response protein AidB-like acyl-CoA dehydrogenase
MNGTNALAGAPAEPKSLTQAARLRSISHLAAILQAEAEEGEKICRLTDKAVQAIREADLFHMLLPKDIGGPEASYLDALEAVEQVSWADGSSGWYVMVTNVICASIGSFLSDRGAKQIYGTNPRAMVAGQGVPRGQARPVDGGYMVKGPWGYGSTIYHADYTHCGCVVMVDGKPKLDDSGAPFALLTHIPISEIELTGNWDTLGLRASGSFDYKTKAPEVFVPEHMTYAFVGSPQQRGGNQYSVGIIGFTTFGHTGWALGVTRRALDEIAKLAPAKAGPFGALGDGAFFKQSYAEAESKFRAARAFVYQAWTDLCETLDRGKPATVERIALIRMAMRHLHNVGSEVTTFAYKAGGGVSLRPSPLQRAYRDLHAGTQHVLLSDQIYQECARVPLGMTGKRPRWGAFVVVDDGPKDS